MARKAARREGKCEVLENRWAPRVNCGMGERLQRRVYEICAAYVHEGVGLGVAMPPGSLGESEAISCLTTPGMISYAPCSMPDSLKTVHGSAGRGEEGGKEGGSPRPYSSDGRRV